MRTSKSREGADIGLFITLDYIDNVFLFVGLKPLGILIGWFTEYSVQKFKPQSIEE